MLTTKCYTFCRSAGGLESFADNLVEVTTETVKAAKQWLGKMSVTSQPLTNNILQAISTAIGTEGVRSRNAPMCSQSNK